MIEGIRRKVADEYKVRVAYSGADMSKAPEIAAMTKAWVASTFS